MEEHDEQYVYTEDEVLRLRDHELHFGANLVADRLGVRLTNAQLQALISESDGLRQAVREIGVHDSGFYEAVGDEFARLSGAWKEWPMQMQVTAGEVVLRDFFAKLKAWADARGYDTKNLVEE